MIDEDDGPSPRAIALPKFARWPLVHNDEAVPPPPRFDEEYWINPVRPVPQTFARRRPDYQDGDAVCRGFKLRSEGFWEWWPLQRQHIQITQADGTLTYAQILSAVDNGDGTVTVGLSIASLSGSPVTLISWLELCRFESDDIDVVFSGSDFKMSTSARVVQR